MTTDDHTEGLDVQALIEAAIHKDRRTRDGALAWETTCLNCANTLDKSYASYSEGYDAGHRDGIADGLAPVEEHLQYLKDNSYRIWAKRLGKAIAKGKRA